MLLMTVSVQSSDSYKLRQKRHILRPFDVMNVLSDFYLKNYFACIVYF